MFKQATVEDIGNKRITKLHGEIVVVTCYYPRFLKRNLINEYAGHLAPTRQLLGEFKEQERNTEDHDQAFDDVAYEAKFALSREAFADLQRLSILASEKTVYLVCHCRVGTRCHREILMLIARELYGASIARLHFAWAGIQARLPDGLALAEKPKKTPDP